MTAAGSLGSLDQTQSYPSMRDGRRGSGRVVGKPEVRAEQRVVQEG